MKYLRNLLLAAAAMGFTAFLAAADDDDAAPKTQAPDREEIMVPTSQLNVVLSKYPRAVLLTRDQYETLLRDASKTPVPGAEPPSRAVLASARYNGELSGDVIDVQAEFTVKVLSDNWAEVPLRMGSLALGDIKIDGDAAFSADNNNATTLMIRGKGEHKITAEFMLPVKKDSGVSSVQLSLPRSGAALFTFNVPSDTQVESSQPLDLKKNADSTTVSLPLSAQNDVVVSWHGTGDAQQGSAVLFEENSYIYSIDETRVQADLGIVLNAALGSLPQSLQIKIPAGSTPLQVVGNEVLKWTADGDGLTVDLTPGDRKTVGIRVLLETPSEILPGATLLPLPEVAGVRRSAGKFAVIGSRGVKIKDITTGEGVVQAEGIFDNTIEQDPQFVAGYGFAVQPAAVKVSIEKVTPRFSADLDSLVEFKREAIFVERTLALRGEEGEIFEANLVMPPGEELISVRNNDDSEPDWKADGASVKIRFSDGLAAGQQRIFKIQSRMEPPNWPETDGIAVGDLKITGAEKVNGYLALKADEMFRVETAGVEGLEKRDGRTTPVKGDFAWFRREAFQLQVKLSRRAPEMQAVLLGYALPVDGALDVHGQLGFNILYSGVNKLRVKVPAASADQFYFDGAQIAERNRDGDTWTIVLQKEITGYYALKFHAVIPFDESQSNFHVDVPDVEPLDVKQQTGTWAVEANTSTEVSFQTTGMNELDPLHAPVLPDYQPRHHVIGVYGYLGGKHSLQLEGVKHEAAPILTAVADRLDLDTVVSTSGAERHQAVFYIRTVGDQFLDVTLPGGSSVWSLTVNGQPLKPVSEKQDVVRVQLPATLDRTRATVVQLVYETRRKEWSGSGGYELVAPRLDARIPVLQSHWHVWLPDGFTYTSFDSNLQSNIAADTTPLLFAPFEWIKKKMPFLSQPAAAISAPQDVNKLLAEADGFFNQGRFDLAYKRYDQVLSLDPGNAAARGGQEKVNDARVRYADESYNETRALQNYQVTKQWETPPRKYMNREVVRMETGANPSVTEYIENKLNRIIIPQLYFKDATLRDSIEFLHRKSIELDTFETDPSRKGVNFVLKLEAPPSTTEGGPAVSPADQKITLSLTNIPLSEALRYICELAGLKYKIDPYAVTIVPLSEPTTSLITKEYRVPAGFLQSAGVTTALDYLKNTGVMFPDGASANYLPSSSTLVVRNTEENLDLVDQIVDALQATPAESEGMAGDRVTNDTGMVLEDGASVQANAGTASDTEYIQNKLNHIIIPQINFHEATVRDALEYISRKTVELDTTEADPARKGVNIVMNVQPAMAVAGGNPVASPADTKITLSLANIPAAEALRYIASLAGMKVKVDPYAVSIVPLAEGTEVLVTKEYTLPPGFLGAGGGAAGQAVLNGPGAAYATPAMPSSLAPRLTAMDYLKNAGVQFPDGATATFLPGSNKLIVRNTENNLDTVDQVVQPLGSTAAGAGGFGGNGAVVGGAVAATDGDGFSGTVNYGSPIAGKPHALALQQPIFDTRRVERLDAMGLLPMKLDLQHAGRQFSFDGFYAAQSVSFRYVDWWSQARRGWVWWIAGGMLFFAAGGFGAWRRLAWGVLFLTFIPICVAQSLTGMCNALLVGWITGFVIHQIATRMVFRRRVVEVAAA